MPLERTVTAASYFDVDGTLAGSNLLHPTLLYLANAQTLSDRVLRVGTALLSGPALALAELNDRRVFNELLFSHFRGLSDDRMVCLGEEVYRDAVKKRLFQGTRDLIRKTQDAGMRVVLVTGSLSYTMWPMADDLNIPREDVLANRLELKDGVATGKLLRPVVAGPGKAQILVEDAQAHGHDLAGCYAYSDSYSDVPMLSVVGHPYVVNPDRRLRRLALAYDWPILDLDRPLSRGGSPRSER